METVDVVEAVAEPMGKVGAAFYFHPDTLARGKELGLDGFRFYMLGRAGVMGDVPPRVVESAFGYFARPLVEKIYTSAKERVAPAEAATAYFECAAELGRTALADLDGLEAYCAAAEKVIEAALPAAMPLFAGIASMPLADDHAARALQLTAVLRELRGSVHLVAVISVGLADAVAHAIRRPDDVATFGYDEPPVVTDADRAKLAEADQLTNQLLVGPYGVLDGAEGQAIVDGVTAIQAALG